MGGYGLLDPYRGLVDDELHDSGAGLALRSESPLTPEPLPSQSPWWERYRDNLRDHPNGEFYNWNDHWFRKINRGKGAFRPIPLTRGYFMIVSVRDYWRMTHFPDGSPKLWRCKVDHDTEGNILGIYGRRNGRKNEPNIVYAHRELEDCLLIPHVEVDHVNRHGLDNRRENLDLTSKNGNMHNAVRSRWKHTDLERGVIKRGKNAKGQQRYGAQRCVRVGKKVITIRSRRFWLTQEPAAQWYRNQLKRLYDRSSWAHDPKSVAFAIFPPRMESEPIPFRRPTRNPSLAWREIPF